MLFRGFTQTPAFPKSVKSSRNTFTCSEGVYPKSRRWNRREFSKQRAVYGPRNVSADPLTRSRRSAVSMVRNSAPAGVGVHATRSATSAPQSHGSTAAVFRERTCMRGWRTLRVGRILARRGGAAVIRVASSLDSPCPAFAGLVVDYLPPSTAPVFEYSVVPPVFEYSVVPPLFEYSVVPPLFEYSVVPPAFEYSVVPPDLPYSTVPLFLPYSIVPSFF